MKPLSSDDSTADWLEREKETCTSQWVHFKIELKNNNKIKQQ